MNGWPYPSATDLVTSHLKKTLVTGNTGFLEKLSPDFVTKDLVNYEHVRKATEKFPDWRTLPSIPQSGDPYQRMEEISL
jgi:NitT/TauT family transport system substrate-binding protein